MIDQGYTCEYTDCEEPAIVEFSQSFYCDKHHSILLEEMYRLMDPNEYVEVSGRKIKSEKPVVSSPDDASIVADWLISIEQWSKKHSKRFRMTKDQKQRGLTREEAFEETYG